MENSENESTSSSGHYEYSSIDTTTSAAETLYENSTKENSYENSTTETYKDIYI